MSRLIRLLPVVLLTACFAKADDDDDDDGGDDTADPGGWDADTDTSPPGTEDGTYVPPDDETTWETDGTWDPEDTGYWVYRFEGGGVVTETAYNGREDWSFEHWPDDRGACRFGNVMTGVPSDLACPDCEWAFDMTPGALSVYDDTLCDTLGLYPEDWSERRFSYGYAPEYYDGYDVLLYAYGSSWYAIALAGFDGRNFHYDRVFGYYYDY